MMVFNEQRRLLDMQINGTTAAASSSGRTATKRKSSTSAATANAGTAAAATSPTSPVAAAAATENQQPQQQQQQPLTCNLHQFVDCLVGIFNDVLVQCRSQNNWVDIKFETNLCTYVAMYVDSTTPLGMKAANEVQLERQLADETDGAVEVATSTTTAAASPPPFKLPRLAAAAVDDNSNDDNNDNNKVDVAENREHDDAWRSNMFLQILQNLILYLEQRAVVFLFSRETLKYYLATYSTFISPIDFMKTNAVAINNSSATATAATATTATIGNGPDKVRNTSILLEYGKGFDSFVSALPKADASDVEALKTILNHKIMLSASDLYQHIYQIQYVSKPHVQDTKYTSRPDYCTVANNSANKFISVLVTANIVMIHDGYQFTIPTPHVDREFTATIRQNCKLNAPTDYALLDVLYSNRIRILDIAQLSYTRVDGATGESAIVTDLPTNYRKRLELIGDLFPGLTLVTLVEDPPNTTVSSQEISYVHIKRDSSEDLSSDAAAAASSSTIYYYHKHNLTAAAVGVCDKNVVLAFVDDKDPTKLAIKTKVSISGAVSCMLAAMPTTLTTIKGCTVVNNTPECVNDLATIMDVESAEMLQFLQESVAAAASAASKLASHPILVQDIKDPTQTHTMYVVNGDSSSSSSSSSSSNSSLNRLNNNNDDDSPGSSSSSSSNSSSSKAKNTSSDYTFRMFKQAIPVELRESNRLGSYSHRVISRVSEYKPVVVKNDNALLKDYNKIFKNKAVFCAIFKRMLSPPYMRWLDSSCIKNIRQMVNHNNVSIQLDNSYPEIE